MSANPSLFHVRPSGEGLLHRSVPWVLALSAVMLPASATRADSIWNALNGDWFTAGNWLGGVPASGDNATINNGGTALVESPGAEAQLLFVGEGTDDGTLLIQSGGTLTLSALSAGSANGGFSVTGDVTVSGAGSALNVFSIGFGPTVGGTGNLTITGGGTVSGQNANLVSGVATVDGAGSSWSISNPAETFGVGSVANGLLKVHNGATVHAPGGIELAAGGTGDGTVEIGGSTGGILNTPSLHGGNGTATLKFIHSQQSGYFFTDDGTAGGTPIDITGSIGIQQFINLSSTTLMGANTYTGGTTVFAGTLRAGTAGAFPDHTAYVVNSSGGNGFLNLNGFDLTMSSLSNSTSSGGIVSLGSAALTIDQAGDTAFNGRIQGAGSLTKQGAGTLTLTGTLAYSGGTTVHNGTLTIAGTTINHAAADTDVGVQSGDNATLTIINGGDVHSDRVRIGLPGSTGSVTVDGVGSSLTAGNNIAAGVFGIGTLNLTNGGTAQPISTIFLGFASDALGVGTGTLNIGIGGAPGIVDAAAVAIGSAGANATINFNHNDAGYFFTNDGTDGGTPVVISNTIAVNHIGPGTTVLTAASFYTGGTTIDAGVLLANNTAGSATGLGPVQVNAGGTLGGTGSVGGAVTVAGGTVAPGESAGTLSTGSLTLDSASVLDFELDGLADVNDLIAVTGNLTLDGTLNVTNLGGLEVGAYTLLTYTGNLTDNGLAMGTLPEAGGFLYSISTSNPGSIMLDVQLGFVLGDWNRDGFLTNIDIQAMLDALVDLEGYKTANALSDADLIAVGDINGDAIVSNTDIQPLLDLLTGGNALSVPEPASGGLTLLLAAMLWRFPRAGRPTRPGPHRRDPRGWA